MATAKAMSAVARVFTVIVGGAIQPLNSIRLSIHQLADSRDTGAKADRSSGWRAQLK
jgi:hypothetical protein